MKVKLNSGHTLLELMIVMLIFSLFLYGVYTTLDFGMKSWQMGEVKSDIYQKAQVVINSIVREFTYSSWLCTELSEPNDPNKYICFETPVNYNTTGSTNSKKDGKPVWQGYIIYYTYAPSSEKNIYRRYRERATKTVNPLPLSNISSYLNPSASGDTVRIMLRDIYNVEFTQKETSLLVNLEFKVEIRKKEDAKVMFATGRDNFEYIKLKTSVTPKNF